MKYTLVFIIILFVCSCSKRHPAPVTDAKQERTTQVVTTASTTQSTYNKPKFNPNYTTVNKGESLYSIGFKHSLDYKYLARINNIPAPYNIYPGQILRLKATKTLASNSDIKTTPIIIKKPIIAIVKAEQPIYKPVVEPMPTRDTQPINTTQDNRVILTNPVVIEPTPTSPVNTTQDTTIIATKPFIEPMPTREIKPTTKPNNNVVITTTTKPVIKPINKPVVTIPVIKPAPKPRISQPLISAPSSNHRWIWPVTGKIVSTFSNSDVSRKGIDIASPIGKPVFASSDGTVVYSGDGLLGYGELIIIKHQKNFLSAYAYNSSRLVKEGTKVKQGQQIAKSGKGSNGSGLLHFELRLNGQPVNPLKYLPK